MSNFRPIDRETGFLLPPSVDEWLPEKHLARFVVEVVEGLDLRAMSGGYRGSGSASYHPRMLLGLLVYGYATGVFSSRKLERATYDSVAFRFIAANDHPDHDTIATFRRRFLEEIEALFVQVLQLAREMGVLKMGTVALDGTKIHANASRHSALSGYVTHLATDEAPEDGENGFAYWPTAMDRQRETDRGENKAAEGKNRHGRHIRQQRADREHDQTERQHVGPRILNPKVLRRSPGFAGVGASVMLSCQEGESPTDVKSWHM